MDITAYFKSLTQELEAQKDRVRNLIGDAHWLTDGEWKESVLRSVLSSRLPDTVKIGRGFIVTQDWTSTQCDILIYKANSPVIFREGELVILPPNAVLGVFEVKTRIDTGTLRESVGKLAAIGPRLPGSTPLGLFSYESSISEDSAILSILSESCDQWNNRLHVLCLGADTFVKWWDCPPLETASPGADMSYQKWHSYRVEKLAAGYFLTNVIDLVCPNWLFWNYGLWFPATGKEAYKTGEIGFKRTQG